LIQLDFEHPAYISATYNHPESVNLTIFGVNYFNGSLGSLMSLPSVLNLKALPPIASKGAIQKALNQVGKVRNSLQSFLLIQFFSGSIQGILGSYRHTQIILHNMMIAVN